MAAGSGTLAGPTRAWLPSAVVGAAGLANGALTLIAFGTLGEGWNTLGNSGAIWLLVAFAIGAVMPSIGLAAAAGGATLAGSVVWFYMDAHYVVGIGVSSATIAIWLVAALAGGPAFGLAGWSWRRGERRAHVVGSTLMAGAFIAEGASMLIQGSRLTVVGWVAIAIGLALALALPRTSRDRRGVLLALPIVAAAGVAAYAAIYGTLASI